MDSLFLVRLFAFHPSHDLPSPAIQTTKRPAFEGFEFSP